MFPGLNRGSKRLVHAIAAVLIVVLAHSVSGQSTTGRIAGEVFDPRCPSATSITKLRTLFPEAPRFRALIFQISRIRSLHLSPQDRGAAEPERIRPVHAKSQDGAVDRQPGLSGLREHRPADFQRGNHAFNLDVSEGVNFVNRVTGVRPYPQYSNVTINTWAGQSKYEALQLSLRRRREKSTRLEPSGISQ